jgi:PAS domain S-box-containing protein
LEKEVSCRISGSVIKYFTCQGFDTSSLLDGLPYSKSYLEEPANWISAKIRDEISKRAVKITNNDRIMFQIGLDTPGLNLLGNDEKIIKEFEGPSLIYANPGKLFSNLDRTYKFEVDLTKENLAIVRKITKRNYSCSIQVCNYVQGLLTSIPVFWGLPPAKVQEFKCACGLTKNYIENKQTEISCDYEIIWQTPKTKSKFSLKNTLFNTQIKIENPSKKLKSSYELLDKKNAELTQRNLQLTKVREITAGIDSAKSVDDVFKLIVDLSMEIPQIKFMLVQKADISTGNLTTPYFSKFRDEEIILKLKDIGIDILNNPGTQLLSEKLNFPLNKVPVISEYLQNRKISVYERLSHVLKGAWSREICDKVQEIIDFTRIIIVPLKLECGYCGSLGFYVKGDIPQDILEMIGTHCCIALKNVLTLQNLERRNQELLAINMIASQTLSDSNIQQIVERSILELNKILKPDGIAAYLLEESKGILELIGQTGLPNKFHNHSKEISVNSEFGKIIASNSTYVKGTMNAFMAYYPGNPSFTNCEDIINFVSVPLIIDTRRQGIITIVRKNNIFDEEEIELFKSLSHQLSIAIENTRLHQNLITRIQELETTKKSLADSEEKMRLTLESASEAIIVTSEKGKIRQANEVAINLHGYKEDSSFYGSQAFKYVEAKDRPKLLNEIKKIKKAGPIKDAEITLIKKNGDKFDAECSISTFNNSAGRIQGFVICVRDISHRKQVEAKLRESERRYRLLADNTNDYVVVTNLKGICVYVSPSHKQLGYEESDLIGKHMVDLVHSEDIHPFNDLVSTYPELKDIDNLLHRNGTNFLNFRIKDKSGEWHDMESSLNLIESPNGKEINILTVSRDVTARKQADEEMQIIYQNEKAIRFALEKEINTRAEFFRALVHELKTPLTPIVVSSETLRDLIQDKMFKKLAENVYQGAIRLNSRVDELLDISRGELGMLKLDCQPMDIGVLIKDVANYIKVQTTCNQQILIVDIPDSLPQINADESRLRQVLLNLLNNAMKFTPPGGQILVTAKIEGGNLTVEVSDNGRGIDEADQARLFEPYNRVEEDRQHFSGLGLGLALSKQLIELHKGKIGVISKKGTGSTFSFSLPINKSASRIC